MQLARYCEALCGTDLDVNAFVWPARLMLALDLAGGKRNFLRFNFKLTMTHAFQFHAVSRSAVSCQRAIPSCIALSAKPDCAFHGHQALNDIAICLAVPSHESLR